MLAFTQLVGFAALSATLLPRVAADVVPTAPGPGDSFNEGSPCPIQWNVDTTGTWTNFTIQLMTGSNQAMTPLATVASGLDGTSGDGKFSWTCPEVTPNSAVSRPPPLSYLCEFTHAGSPTSWTTRFTIASASGQSTEPTETVMVNGKPVGWGTGSLSGASVSLSSGSAGASASSGGAGASGAASAASSSPSGMTVISTPSSSSSAAAAPATTASSSSASSASSVGPSSSDSSSSSSAASQPASASGASRAPAQSTTTPNGASALVASRSSLVSGSVLLAMVSFAILA
ncbi:hypothetical protein JCM11491_000734 [Sporobolomyces phaffii]